MQAKPGNVQTRSSKFLFMLHFLHSRTSAENARFHLELYISWCLNVPNGFISSVWTCDNFI